MTSAHPASTMARPLLLPLLLALTFAAPAVQSARMPSVESIIKATASPQLPPTRRGPPSRGNCWGTTQMEPRRTGCLTCPAGNMWMDSTCSLGGGRIKHACAPTCYNLGPLQCKAQPRLPMVDLGDTQVQRATAAACVLTLSPCSTPITTADLGLTLSPWPIPPHALHPLTHMAQPMTHWLPPLLPCSYVTVDEYAGRALSTSTPRLRPGPPPAAPARRTRWCCGSTGKAADRPGSSSTNAMVYFDA